MGRTARHGCALWLGLGLTVIALALAVAYVLSPLSGWGAAYLVGCGALAAGLTMVALQRTGARPITTGGALLLLATALSRLFTAPGGGELRVTTLPDDDGPRVVARLFVEQDGTLPAARLLEITDGLNDEEGPRFGAILRAAYERMDGAASPPTPAIATYLGLQRPSAFDTVVLPAGTTKAGGAVIFLHGFAGNFAVYCWEFAQAARAAGLSTLCPSVDARGAWWTEDGEQTMLATLRYARQLGARRVYLAGLSNGAAGASVLAVRHRRELSGLILISGTRAPAPPIGLPTLVVQGSRDRMMLASLARDYARGGRARYHEVDGGHLVFLSRHEQVRPIITEFLRARERGAR